MKSGFTLIELSIVLVIIGLIVGGVLVGQDLIAAATIRAQISQIEKYQTAINTFKAKYGYLPGDIPDPVAGQYGFIARGTEAGQGDGNGALEGWSSPADNMSFVESGGETAVFWIDLSAAQLIEGRFSSARSASDPAVMPITSSSTPTFKDFFPAAKIGQQNYVYVWGGVKYTGVAYLPGAYNYFGISAPTSVFDGFLLSGGGLTVNQAYSIDKKIDDGQPMSGTVLAGYLSGAPYWASPGSHLMDSTYSAVLSGSSSTCFDNGGNTANPWVYSTSQSGGTGINCGLSIRFQ